MLAWILLIIVYLLGLIPAWAMQGEMVSFMEELRWIALLFTVLWPIIVLIMVITMIRELIME